MHWEGSKAMASFRDVAHEGVDTSRLQLGPIKVFADGGFTGPAAFTKAPYVGEVSYRGHLNMPENALRARSSTRSIAQAGSSGFMRSVMWPSRSLPRRLRIRLTRRRGKTIAII